MQLQNGFVHVVTWEKVKRERGQEEEEKERYNGRRAGGERVRERTWLAWSVSESVCVCVFCLGARARPGTASDHVPHISDQFMAFTGNTDLAILLNKDTFEPDPIVNTFKADSTSKGSWCMILLIVRGLLRRPSLTGSPTVTFCSVHIHNVVAQKRDASTDLLQRLHGYMREYNVDFIGGDFNMSAFSTVGDVFTDEEFSAPGNSLLWGLGALEEPNRECAGFPILSKRPYEWRVHSHGCYKFDNALLGLGPRD